MLTLAPANFPHSTCQTGKGRGKGRGGRGREGREKCHKQNSEDKVNWDK